jgi:hypothetical protein
MRQQAGPSKAGMDSLTLPQGCVRPCASVLKLAELPGELWHFVSTEPKDLHAVD